MTKFITRILAIGFVCLATTISAQTDLAGAKKLLKEKKWAEAQAAFEELLDSKDTFEVRLGLAKAAYSNGDPDTAGFHAVRAESMNEKSAEAAEWVGRCFLAQGINKANNRQDPSALFEQAEEGFKKSLKLNPKSEEAILSYGQCCYWVATTMTPNSEEWLAKNEEAGKQYEKAFKLSKKMNGVHAYWAGHFHHAAQKKEHAYKLYQAALTAKNSDESTLGSAVGRIYNLSVEKKDWSGLIESVKAWGKAKPKDEFAKWWLAYSLDLDGKSQESSKAWKALENSKRYRAESIYYQGKLANKLGKTDEALTLLKKAASINYTWSEKEQPGLELHKIAGTYFGMGRFKECCEIAEKAALPALKGRLKVMLKSDMGLFYRDWGSSLERQGNKAEARKAYTRARDVYGEAVKEMVQYKELDTPWRAQVLNDYALMFHYHFADAETALKYYRKALELDETNSDACLNFGRIMKRRGKHKEALEVASKGRSRADLDALVRELHRIVNK